jgi:hypothetical protein
MGDAQHRINVAELSAHATELSELISTMLAVSGTGKSMDG